MTDLKEKMGKKKHEYFALQRNLMDSLEGMAQESEEIIQKIYEAVGETHIKIGEERYRYTDLGHVKRFLRGKRYQINIDNDHRICVIPETRTEKRGKVKEKIPTGRLSIKYEPGADYRNSFNDYYFSSNNPTLVDIARRIKAKGNVKDAEKFAELNKRIRNLPTQIVKHLEKRSKELEAARTLGSVKDIDKLDYISPECRHCSAPNPDLEPVCGHCGHKAYEIPKKVKGKK